MALSMISTTVSDIGLVRKDNQDSTFAGVRLIAVCDGMGGHAGGDTASTIAIRSLAHIENIPLVANKNKAITDVATMLSTSVIAAHDAIVGKAHREKSLAGMGTTVTSVALVAGHWVISHIGDSRAYLLREGEIIRVTKDHSYVQHLIDTGRITEEEAKSHPQRNVVMRVLGDFDIDPRPDVSIHKAQAGDRWLLCSDGLSGVVSEDSIRDTLLTHPHMQECAQTLIMLAEKGGSTDNVSAVIADAYDADDPNIPVSMSHASAKMCLVAGAASKQPQTIADTLNLLVAVAPKFVSEELNNSPVLKAAQLTASSQRADAADNSADSYDADDNADYSDFLEDEDSDAQYSDGTDDGYGYGLDDDYSYDVDYSGGYDMYSVVDARAQREAQVTVRAGSVSDITDQSTDTDLDSRYEVQRIVRPNSGGYVSPEDAAVVAATGEIPIIQKKDGSIVDDPHDPDVMQALHIRKIEDERDWKRKKTRRRILWAIPILLLLAALGIGTTLTYNWSQNHYFIKENNGVVAIYQGVDTDIFGYSLSHVLEDTSISMADLPQGWQERISKGIDSQSYADARDTIQTLENEVQKSQSGNSSQSVQSEQSGSQSSNSSENSSSSSSDSSSSGSSTSQTGSSQ